MPKLIYTSEMIIGNVDVYSTRNAPVFAVTASGSALPNQNIPIRIVSAIASWTVRDDWTHDVLIKNNSHNGTILGSGWFGNGWTNLSTDRSLYQSGLLHVCIQGDGGTAGTLKSGTRIKIEIVWEYTDVPSTVTASPASVELKQTVTSTVSATFSNYNHKIAYRIGSGNWTEFNLNTGVKKHSFTIPSDWAKYSPSSSTAKMDVRLQSFDGARLIGTKYTSVNVNIPNTAQYRPSATIVSVTPTNQRWGLSIQNFSGMSIAYRYKETSGSPIQKAVIKIGTVSATANGTKDGTVYIGSYDLIKLKDGGTVQVRLDVTDMRGFVGSAVSEISVEPYVAPVISSFIIERSGTNNLKDETGTRLHAKSTFSYAQVGQNAVSFIIETREKGSPSWTRIYTGPAFNSFVLLDGVFAVEKRYEAKLTIRDEITQLTPFIKEIQTGYVFQVWDKEYRSIGLGGYPQRQKSFELAPDFELWSHGKEINVWMNEKANANHTHDVVTQSNNGMMSANDKVKLDSMSAIQNLTNNVTQNTPCRKLTVTKCGKIVTLSVQSQQKSWSSGQTVITLPADARPAGELDIPFVMGAVGQGVFRIRTDGVCLCAAVSTNESKSIMTTITYLAAN